MMGGNRFWNVIVASFWCGASPKLLSTTSGGERNAEGGERGFFCELCTSRASVYLCTRKLKVGPRGARQILTYLLLSVALRIRKCEIPNGPATCTKSFSLFVLLSFKFTAV